MSDHLANFNKLLGETHFSSTHVQTESGKPPVVDNAALCAATEFIDLVAPDVVASMVAAGDGSALAPNHPPVVRQGIDAFVPGCELVPATVEDIWGVADLEARADAILANIAFATTDEERALVLSVVPPEGGFSGMFAQACLLRPPERQPPPPRLKRPKPVQRKLALPSLFDGFATTRLGGDPDPVVSGTSSGAEIGTSAT